MKKEFLLQAPRGTADILPKDQDNWRYIENKTLKIAELYGFERIDTPTFEYAWIFNKGIGAGTDIVDKELYKLENKDNENNNALVLRPEGTAGIVRSYYSNGLYSLPSPLRVYYYGRMYRHDKPQKGRLREFNQFGVESIGEGDATEDALIIMLASQTLNNLSIAEKHYELQINSIGCPICSPKYLSILKKYLNTKSDKLCEECKTRANTNPMRVLDCKNERCRKITKNSPVPLDNLCPDCKDHFKHVLEYLEEINIPFNINYRLVRGLDYYSRTVFEFISKFGDTKKQALTAGGRYDDLISRFGKKTAPAIGFSMGIERVVQMLKDTKISLPKLNTITIYIIQIGNSAKKRALFIARELTNAGVTVLTSLSKDSLKSQLKSASKSNARYALIIGQREILDKTVIMKDLVSGGQEIVDQDNYLTNIHSKLK